MGSREKKGGKNKTLAFFSLRLFLCGNKFFLIHDPGRDAPESSKVCIRRKKDPGYPKIFVNANNLIFGLQFFHSKYNELFE